MGKSSRTVRVTHRGTRDIFFVERESEVYPERLNI